MTWSTDQETRREQMRRDNARRREAKAAWEREWMHTRRGRATCVVCGGLAGANTGRPSKGPITCSACIAAKKEQRLTRIAELFNAGVSMKDIAAEIDVVNVCRDVDELRKAGRVGYRYNVENGRRVA